MSGPVLAFVIASAIAVGAALAVVTSRSPVYSVIFLILNFFATAVLFLLLGAEFLAAIQVLVYAGAIMVLFLFVVMLLNLRRVERWRTTLLAYVGYALAAGMGFELVWQLARRALGVGAGEAGPPPVGTIQAIGEILYTRYLFLFEATSVLLFIAVIGAVVLAKQVGLPQGPRGSRSPLAPALVQAPVDGAAAPEAERPVGAARGREAR